MNVGFVGLGNMGGAIARRILRVRNLHVFDIRPEAVEEFGRAGAAPARSPQELAAVCDTVLTCLPTSDEVHTVIFDDDGLLGGLAPGGIIADMTTGDPTATRKMAALLMARDIHLIDAPVSGGPQGAEKGTLAIMVGGPRELYDQCFEVFSAVSPNIFHAGGVGSGHTMKLVNNVISACNRAVAFEAVTLAVKNGLDPSVCVDILQKGSGRSYHTEITLPKFILSGEMKQGFSLGLMHKDVSLATKLGRDSGTPMVVGEVVRGIFQAVVNAYGKDADINTLIRAYEEAADATVAPLGVLSGQAPDISNRP